MSDNEAVETELSTTSALKKPMVEIPVLPLCIYRRSI